MGFDSAASLLFNIGANSDDAEENIQRFRQLMGTSLDDLATQFSDWSDEVFGKLETVKGAMLGVTAVVAAAGVAIAAFATEASEKFADEAIEIDNASKKTGIHIEEMSKLKFAADEIGVSFGSLTQGLVRLSYAMFDSGEGSKLQRDAFASLGITQKDLAAGQQNILPLLEKMADRFSHVHDGAQKAAMAQVLFSRGGSDLIRFLNLGSEGIKEFAAEAERLGLVLTDKDVVATRQMKAGIEAVHNEQKALDKYVAEHTMPLIISWKSLEVAFMETMEKVSEQGVTELTFFPTLIREWRSAMEEAQKTAELGTKMGGSESLPGVGGADGSAKAKKAQQDFKGISEALQEVETKIAETQGAGASLVNEIQNLQTKATSLAQQLAKLHAEGKLGPGVWDRETKALSDLITAIDQYAGAKGKEQQKKQDEAAAAHNQAIADAARELRDKLESEQDSTYAHQVAKWEEEINQLRAKLTKEKTLTAENEAALEALRAAGLAKLERAQTDAFTKELTNLQSHMASVVEGGMSEREKLDFQYELDLAKYSEVEAAKTQAFRAGGAERQIIEQQFALNRQAVTQKYDQDLQKLLNSQGWRGVFGDHFAALIRGDQQLVKEWETSTHQSMLMVSVALQSMKEMMQQTFDQFENAMGQAIAQSFVYSNSIGQAMRAATAAALVSLSARAYTEAIYSAAVGFLDLAEGDFAGAAMAFEAAGLFGILGTAAAVGGRAVAPKSPGSASGARTGGGSGSGASSGSSGSAYGNPYQNGGGRVNIYVGGSIIGSSGIDELTDMINQAVSTRDVPLLASQVRQTGGGFAPGH